MVSDFKAVYVLNSGGEDIFFKMFLLSLLSLKLHDPGRKVEVVMDAESLESISTSNHPALEGVKLTGVETPAGYDLARRSRYLKTGLRDYVEGDFLYLDSDTIICGPLDEAACPEADLAAVADENGPLTVKNAIASERCRKAGFNDLEGAPFFNGGVFWVKDSPLSRRFFAAWRKRWQESLGRGMYLDQPALCQANKDLGMPIRELPGKWNCQVCSVVGPSYFRSARVIHYFASFSTFPERVVAAHVNEPADRVDEYAMTVLSDPKEKGLSLYRDDRSPALKMAHARMMRLLSKKPLLFKIARQITVYASNSFSLSR